MRILRLELERYGPFEGRTLSFRQDAGLHVVFGRNEAGKTTSLAAVTDLLFGIERATPFAFLHPRKDLRLAATIADRAGRRLSFRRRPNRPLLSDLADAPLPDDCLAPFLGGLGRDVFRRAFGLDAEALRRSGEDLQRSDGELGGALLAAASGLRGFATLQKALATEAEDIFAPRSSQNRRFYQAHARYEAARAALRQREMRAGALKELHGAVASAEAALSAVGARRTALRLEQARLERLRRAAPVIRAIDELSARLDVLSVPEAPEGLGTELARAIEVHEAARRRLHDVREGEQALRRQHDSLPADDALLAEADAIERLLTESGAYLKALQDLPRVQAEADGFSADLADVAVRLGLPDAQAVLGRRPGDAVQARAQRLIARGVRLEADAEARRTALAAARADHAGRLAERERRGGTLDPRPLRERHLALAPALRRIATARAQSATLAADERLIAEAARRLSPPVADIEALARARLPSRERVADFAARWTQLGEALRRHDATIDVLAAEIAGFERTLADIAAERPVPTPERMAQARLARDEAWQGLRPALFAEGEARTASALAAAVAAFEAAKAEADRLADEALHDAARVERHAAASRGVVERRTAMEAAANARASARAAGTDLREEWRAEWREVGLEPLSPAEMDGWLTRAETLLERRAALVLRREEARQVAEEERALLPIVGRLAEDTGLPVHDTPDVMALSERLAAEIDRRADAWDAARSAEAVIAETSDRIRTGEAAFAEAGAALAEWRAALDGVLAELGLAAGSGADEVAAALRAWADVPGIAASRDDRTRRAAGMRRDIAAFETDVGRLLGQLGEGPVEDGAEPAIRRVGQRLTAARQAFARREDLARRIEAAQADAADAERRHGEAASALQALAARCGDVDPSGLADLARALAQRDQTVAELRSRRGELDRVADGRSEAELRDALATYDAETADAELAALSREEEELTSRDRDASGARKDAERRLAELEGSLDAETALLQRRAAEAEMLEAARDWAVVSLASAMIGTAIERRRGERQGPLLARAGALFGTLTGGSYQGLAQEHDEDDVPRLVGIRAGGGEVTVSAMSEGTRDQLYLALRLAYLEDYAGRNEPAPFIGDDLFASFDDERTAHGLEALAAVGGTVQPILFTHHRFVVEAAQRQLGDTVDVVEL